MSFEEFAEFVAEYTLEKVSELSGVPAEKLQELAKLYADPKTKVTSYWTMGFNQHSRGTWVNNMVYNIHLLTGKISEPGNGPLLAHRATLGLRHRSRGRHVRPSVAGRSGGKKARTPGLLGKDLEAAGRHAARQGRLSRGAAKPHAQRRQAQRLLGDVQ